MAKKTRGRVSKADLLPKDIKTALNSMLRDGRLAQQEILDIVNNLVLDAGLSDESTLSYSSLNRYSTQFETNVAKMRQSRQVADMWTTKYGDEPESQVGKLLQEVIRTMAFDTTMALSGAEDPVPPKVISQLALAITRIEQAASQSLKREKEIQQAYAAKMADTIGDEMRGQDGMSEAFEARIRNILMGKE